MNNERAFRGGGASPALRDRFLIALDADDHSALPSLSCDLQSCTDILPSTVCVPFGLPRGNTYAKAAKTIAAS
jgi:hypothetical protein